MIQIYVAKIEYFSESDFEEKVNYSLIPAHSYPDAAQIILEEWGEDNVTGMEIRCVADDVDCSSITISESMADAFAHDIVSDVYVCESDWRRKHRTEKLNKEK